MRVQSAFVHKQARKCTTNPHSGESVSAVSASSPILDCGADDPAGPC